MQQVHKKRALDTISDTTYDPVPGSLRILDPSLLEGNGRRLAWKLWLTPTLMVTLDALLALTMWMTAHAAQSLLNPSADSAGTIALTAASSVTVWVCLRALLGLYPGYGLDEVEILRRHTYSILAATATIAALAPGLQVKNFAVYSYLVTVFVGLLFLTPFLQHLTKRSISKMGLWGKPVMLLGSERVVPHTMELLKREWGLGYDPVAIIEFDPALDDAASHGMNLYQAAEFSKRSGVDTLIFAMPHTRREQVVGFVEWASVHFKQVLVIPNLSGVTNSAVVARNLAGTFAVEVKHNLLDPWALRFKRALEFSATLVGGMLILPLLFILGLMVRLESGGGPIFYRDARMGHNGELFSCLKFRTMVPGAEDLLQRLLEEDAEAREEYAKYHKLSDDPRVTRIGHFLRKTSLDELPQLWNVLKGEMSLVGPRPYLPRETADIGPTRAQILRVAPGITGLWQVDGRSKASFSERVNMDADYIRDWSVWLDLVILARTAKTVLLARGAY